ncbi:MAG: DUF1015 domain-containing protein [Candidatus Tectomicrobia bacterium]|uniref:DUF1015 domain-containing protein n=1 Tax=Tectimicrobiota bacterium TaxID=2528274 RepID=A0A932FXJ6_UNCTE|nr:DUF1015 domain-containing protein [Candidatus Tectomicrobia bacterium]
MAIVLPFQGTLYQMEAVGDIDQVVAPPYDVISPQEQELYYQRSPFNIIRLILGTPSAGDRETCNRYTRAADYLRSWVQQGVLRVDPDPAFYLYRQIYTLEGERRVRRGFIGRIRLEDYDQGAVLPHEKTLPAPKADRLALLRACRANLSPIFGLYSDPAREVSSLMQEVEARGEEPPGSGVELRFQLKDDRGVEHTLWSLSQKERVEEMAAAMRARQILIADGHHRYETALEYRREMRRLLPASSGEEPFDYTMIYLANLDDEGISILSTHRLVRHLPDRGPDSLSSLLERVEEHFRVESLPLTPGTGEEVRQACALLEAIVPTGGAGLHLFGLYAGGDCFYRLILKGEALPPALLREGIPEVWRTLDVVILHRLLLEQGVGLTPEEIQGQCLGYTQDAAQAIRSVRSGAYQLAFLVNPTRIEEVRRVATSGARMPEKSTYFYPKLLSGLVLRQFEA